MKSLEIPKVALDALCHLNSERYPFLLESVNHNQNNRYSILFAYPSEQIILNSLDDFDFLSELESKTNMPTVNSDLPFTGGWFVYLSYELIGQIEPILRNDLLPSSQAVAIAVKIPTAIVVDHLHKKTYLLDQFDNQQRIGQVLSDIAQLQDIPTTSIQGELSWEKEAKFTKGVKRSRDYIVAGDVFQVNLSRQWQYKLTSDIKSTQVYQALKHSNPAPFAALANFENFSIISSSPERLFSVDGSQIETRPIAGTHPRGSGEEDELLKQQLVNHPKEQAEHIMLLDLERNDLGRVCEYGSLNVNEVMGLETYPFVHHIVSNIKGKLKQGITIKDIISALFPGGTITGCPKVRCMQIIAELEQMPRQAYTGSLGYISSNGKMDFNILIRTISKQDKILTFRAGAGIVFDSIAQCELEETKYKAKGVLKIFPKDKQRKAYG
ncbi:aminodeoxychorismate synthase component I [thiotrophic endosymbiont of Bathymodiolus puteoserpentis (Logatchev)]|uniref:aminodeoxychorismate synthase component I n=1 Tax=thiotrophic endosymbiont of Bathymodiolus puteoserpentis (Logatchev) TaxID=343240 RepID=UPI0010B10D06|nr:aminodeoxychorismate synthase component I [thiotrophic endosymbiont of Bathymodiolus puteoserpentis (Logatchev)]SSC09898.1 Para-aminobenzoate synthase, aminase component [thiotrophic endosymbiont of Bathymodiolus puteoserpentis (Logatchev)]